MFPPPIIASSTRHPPRPSNFYLSKRLPSLEMRPALQRLRAPPSLPPVLPPSKVKGMRTELIKTTQVVPERTSRAKGTTICDLDPDDPMMEPLREILGLSRQAELPEARKHDIQSPVRAVASPPAEFTLLTSSTTRETPLTSTHTRPARFLRGDLPRSKGGAAQAVPGRASVACLKHLRRRERHDPALPQQQALLPD